MIALQVVNVLFCLETDVRHSICSLLIEYTRSGLRRENEGIDSIIDRVRDVDDF